MRLLDLTIGLGLIHDLKEETFDVLDFPRETIEEHLEDDDAHRPDIAFVGIVVFGEVLRGHVDGHSHQLLVAA